MKTQYSKSIMASYATFKELYNSNKYNSPYQILSEFINFIIVDKSLYTFTSTDMQNYLNSEFGFNPPIAVIRTALKSVPGIVVEQQTYRVVRIQENNVFEKYRSEAETRSDDLTDALVKYAEEKNMESLDRKKLSQEFIVFVLDEEGDPIYQQVIGSFILANEINGEITSAISAIREGSILYSGLAFNISELGSLNQKITLFLDTEIIFDILGLNGLLYQALAEDFITLVNTANKGGKVITLKFFSKVSDDIDQFYRKAENIVAGHGEINFSQAMKSIIEGCQDVSDVSDKKVDLYRRLKIEFAINKDAKEDYYTKDDAQYNLEGMELFDFPTTETINEEGFMFCSHINKLRKGSQTKDYLSSKYLCVSDTRRVIEISKAIAEETRNQKTGEKYCGYAVSLNYITNLLWYKLNGGFGSTEFPKNLNVIFKARTILSGYISQGISAKYKDICEKVTNGELTKEQTFARIIALKEKVLSPENLDKDNIEELLDFSEERFNQFEENLAQNKKLLLERDKTIEQLFGDKQELQGQLSHALKENEEKQKQIDDLSKRVNDNEKKESEKVQKKQKRKELLKFLWSCAWRIIVTVLVIVSVWGICVISKKDFPTWLGVVIGLCGLIISGLSGVSKRWNNYKKTTKHIDNQLLLDTQKGVQNENNDLFI